MRKPKRMRTLPKGGFEMDGVTWKAVKAVERLLKPCPFCGKSVEIGICDHEGNFHGSDYLREPYSGLMFVPTHRSGECVLTSDPDEEEMIGHFLYGDLYELMKKWNRRAGVI